MVTQTREIAQMSELEVPRLEWIASFRGRTPSAQAWAAGWQSIRHSLETQERIFRLYRRLEATGQITELGSFFAVLRKADRLVATEMTPAEGARWILTSLGLTDARAIERVKIISVHLGDVPTERATVGPVLWKLRASKCDPIVFDATDPAAYAWAIYEIVCRQGEANPDCDCHPDESLQPVGIALSHAVAGTRKSAPAGTAIP